MKRLDWLVGIAVLIVPGLLVWYLAPKSELSYRHAKQVWVDIQSCDFHCTSDCADGQFANGFFVSRESASWSDLNALCKAGPRGSSWKGVVWVSTIYGDRFSAHVDHADARVWGRVYAFGDDELLNEIENALRGHRS